jgi:hypothetical protein
MIIKRRRLAAYKFLKRHKSLAIGRGKIVTIDMDMLPDNGFTKEEFAKIWKQNQQTGIILNPKK